MISPSDFQAELALRVQRTPEKIENDSRELEQLLRGRGFISRRQIEALRPDWRDGGPGRTGTEGRYVRLLAERSGKIISGPGLPGYRLADDTTLDDLEVDDALSRAAFAIVAQMRAEAKRVRHYRSVLGLRLALRKKLEGAPS
jgi:hypothetical protein